MMVDPVVVLVPVLRRPHRVDPLLASISEATPEQHRVLFLCSPDDPQEIAAVEASGADMVVMDRPAGPGDYAAKINHGYRCSSEPLLFLGADDLHFHPGWLPAAAALMRPPIGVVGTNDMGNVRVMAGHHATHFLVSRAYADEHGTIDGPGVLHEGYSHNFVDDELLGTARKRGAWAFAANSMVEHLHPNWKKGQRDEVYRLGMAGWDRDRDLLRERRRLWK